MKKYDVVARIGSYTDSQGQEKGRFENVGAVIQNQNGGFNLLLKKTFNPAGLAEPGQESVILSLFEPQQKDSQPQRQPAMNQKQPNPREFNQNQASMQAQAPDFDDDLPF